MISNGVPVLHITTTSSSGVQHCEGDRDSSIAEVRTKGQRAVILPNVGGISRGLPIRDFCSVFRGFGVRFSATFPKAPTVSAFSAKVLSALLRRGSPNITVFALFTKGG